MNRISFFSSGNARIDYWPRDDDDDDEEVTVGAVAGSQTIDLRQVELPRRLARLKVFVLFGNAEIIVPPDVDVLSGSDVNVLGTVELPPRTPASPSDRRLRVDATAIVGSVKVRVRE